MKNKIISLAKEIINLSRTTLIVNLRFLDKAISLLEPDEYMGTMAVDGNKLFYNPTYVLKIYRQRRENPTHSCLHMLLHCIFRHYYINTLIDRNCWDLASDIVVESIILELDLKSTRTGMEVRRQRAVDRLSRCVGTLTAEVLYRYLLDGNISPVEFIELQALFQVDEHSMWYPFPESRPMDSDESEEVDAEDVKQEWKEISEQIQMDLESFSKMRGLEAGNMMMNLRAINRQRHDYTEFLKQFSVLCESMKVNDDEFDYIFYTYGLNLYGNMPLVEPLEYKEVNQIKDFVIAIDTSGSVHGDLVQKFIEKTYNILEQRENFANHTNLHIIQCDTVIQEDVKITKKEEFDRYLRHMTLKGFGGTDFTPVFEYVDHMIELGEFANLKGMIYFTDGYGKFPPHQPDYKTAFIFLQSEGDYDEPEVPVWAIKQVLKEDEI